MSFEKPRPESPKNPGTRYDSRGLLEKSSYDIHILPSLKQNPELDISQEDREIIREYLDRQSPEYQSELRELVKDAPALSPGTKLSIAIPAYKEGANIYKTLDCYSKLENRSEFEIVILENHTKDVERDTTASEIVRFKESHPDMQIAHLYKTFGQKRIGNVRKYLTDSILMRKQMADRNDSILIASNDADLDGINPKYADVLIDTFAREPELDAVRGGVDHSPDSFARFPLMHASVRFLNYFNLALQKNKPDIRLTGRNSVMRSGIYAAVGGYNENAVVAEDLEIGCLINFARISKPGRMKYLHNAWVETNPRREIESVLSGVPIIKRYDGFLTKEHIYDVPVTKLLEEGRDFSPEQFKMELQAIYDHYKSRTVDSEGSALADESFENSYDRAMHFLGIKYHMDDEKVVVDDLSKLVSDLEQYKERNKDAA